MKFELRFLTDDPTEIVRFGELFAGMPQSQTLPLPVEVNGRLDWGVASDDGEAAKAITGSVHPGVQSFIAQVRHAGAEGVAEAQLSGYPAAWHRLVGKQSYTHGAHRQSPIATKWEGATKLYYMVPEAVRSFAFLSQ